MKKACTEHSGYYGHHFYSASKSKFSSSPLCLFCPSVRVTGSAGGVDLNESSAEREAGEMGAPRGRGTGAVSRSRDHSSWRRTALRTYRTDV